MSVRMTGPWVAGKSAGWLANYLAEKVGNPKRQSVACQHKGRHEAEDAEGVGKLWDLVAVLAH